MKKSPGSTSDDIIISLLVPMPPKALAASIPASIVKKRARANSPSTRRTSPAALKGLNGRKTGTKRAAVMSCDRDYPRCRPEYPGGVLRDDLVLVQQLRELVVGLEDARADPLLRPRLHLPHDASEQRRQREHRDTPAMRLRQTASAAKEVKAGRPPEPVALS